MKKYCVLVFFMFQMVFFSESYARSCSSSEQDKAEYFAEQAGRKIVSKFGGGQNKRTSVSSCEFNSYSKIFKVRIEVHWDGSLFSDNHYNIDGDLSLKENGSQVGFARRYANGNVEDLEFFSSFANGVMELSNLSNGTSSSSSRQSFVSKPIPDFGIKFYNRCDKKFRLAIRYKPESGIWTSENWWDFKPHSSGYLSSNGKRLKTKSATVFYYAETSDRLLKTSGNHMVKIGSRYIKMRKNIDENGVTEIAVKCD